MTTAEQQHRRDWLLAQIRNSNGPWTTLRAEAELRRSPWPTSGRNTARKDLRALAARGDLTAQNDQAENRRSYTPKILDLRSAA
ncbi:hypothetical protein R1T08_17105 [Streptomyces sp. SBC-4]|nr:hypothetical protein [Streptomyces sp. SBC-4]MDV5145879.1 hypothetical protein [Streptomyces sp. SBC-4]